MPVTRERVDPIRDPSGLGLVHRRWIVPDDVQRAVPLTAIARLWRGLGEARVLDAAQEVWLSRPGEDDLSMPLGASAGALLAGAQRATRISQVVWPGEQDLRDPYALEGEVDPPGYRDYTLYVVDDPARLLLPIAPLSRRCATCNQSLAYSSAPFGDGVLLDLRAACACGAPIDLARDKGELPGGAVFLFEELCARAALSVELPAAPESEELPDAQVAALLREAFGGTDELAQDGVAPGE